MSQDTKSGCKEILGVSLLLCKASRLDSRLVPHHGNEAGLAGLILSLSLSIAIATAIARVILIGLLLELP